LGQPHRILSDAGAIRMQGIEDDQQRPEGGDDLYDTGDAVEGLAQRAHACIDLYRQLIGKLNQEPAVAEGA